MAAIAVRRYKGGRKVYRVRIRRHGLLVSRQFTSRAEAETFALSTESDLTGRAPAEVTTLAALIDRYAPQASASYGKECLAYWRDKLGHLRLSEITPGLIRAHRDSLAATPARSHNQKSCRPRSSSTVRKYLIVLARCFTFAMKELGWATDNPVKLVAKPRPAPHRIRFLSDDERRRLLDAAREAKRAPCLYAALLLSLTTGLRRGELQALAWRDVDLTTGVAVLRHTKNGEQRGIPLTPEVVAALEALPRDDSGRVFPHDQAKVFATAVAKAGLSNFRWHDLRHDAGSRLAAAGISTRTVMELLGHKTVTMAVVYQHLSAATVREAVMKVMR